MSSRWRPYKEAREYVRSLLFNNPREYEDWSKTPDKPYDIPTTPRREYKDCGWVNWTDYLGTKLGYEESKAAIKHLKIKTSVQYAKFAREHKLPRGVRQQPHKVFKKTGEWLGWPDYLGRDVPKPINKETTED